VAETDIFNPANWQELGFTFNPNPSYGFERKMGANRQIQRPRLGIYPEREVMNGGHVFSLAWINTDITTAQRVIEFYHSFKGGYFTLIDQDWFGRQYVGRFTNEPNVGHPANAKYTFQGVIFEEMPQARMLTYPSPTQFGYPLNVADDYLNPLVALMQGTWVIQVSPTFRGGTSSMAAALEAIDVTPAAGDWAQTAYTGFGFQMIFRLAPTLGTISILLDGNAVATVDLSNGTATAVAAGVNVSVQSNASFPGPFAGTNLSGPFVNVTDQNVPLDQHRVKVVYNGPSAAGGVSIIFPQMGFVY
jgi:hypothetical protein